MSARDQLDRALLDLAADGRRPRCGEHHLWTSEDRAERARAARLCSACPILRQCGLAAEEEHALFVWGGVDRGARPSKKTATKETR